ncbi:MAG: hypothetical protein NTX65_16165 [Ignavibacteriales bacterium]|nr:hypothetical protein [Ignavibacteriales bacterium]
MKDSSNKILFWSPRILSILFALFISIFAFDVFAEGYGFWKTFLAFIIHLIPTALIVIVIIISWRWEWVGGIIFIALPIYYVYSAWGRFPISVYFIMCGPMVLISILFFINWQRKKEMSKKKSDTYVI